jgi:hypothetical protein
MAGAVPLPGLVATPLGQGCSSALRTHCRYCFALSFGVCVFPDSLFYPCMVPSIPLGLSAPGQEPRRPTPRTPVPGRVPGRPGIRLAIRLLRGAETPERLERPRPAARRRNGPGPGDDATGPIYEH